MLGLRDVPIRGKLTLVNLLTSGVAVLLVCLAFFAYEMSVFRRSMLEQTVTQADVIGYNVASALMFADPAAAQTTLAALRAEPAIEGAAIYDEHGHRFAAWDSTATPGVPDLPERVTAATAARAFGAGRLLVTRPILADDTRIGTVAIVASLSGLRSRLVRYAGIAAIVLVAAMAAAIGISWQLQRQISQPILDLVDTTRTVSANKDYSLRAPEAGRDEIGLLVASFNDMLAAIQTRDDDLKQARDAADAGNRAKDEFLAVVSHELRTPLTPILTWTRLLGSRTLDPSKTAHAIESIERSARAQAQIIDDLLDISRIVAGKIRLDLQQVDVASVLEAAIDSTRPTADAKGTHLQLLLDPRAGQVAGDPGRLQQVFWNLLTNAIKFTPKGGRVQVQLRRINSHVEVSVSDSGQGIAPEFLAHVFERFRQADSSSRRAYGGLGLGLAIVRQLVELHGGTVRADSPGEGLGATFTVELPLSLLRSQPHPDRAHPTTSSSIPFAPSPEVLHGVRVLVVDDEPDSLETIRTVLEMSGADVRSASSAPAALATLETWLPDVLVSDIGMPGEDGYSLIRRLRLLPAARGGAVPALALTAYARVEDRLRVLEAGFQMHVPKPIEPAELVALVTSLTDWQTRRPPA